MTDYMIVNGETVLGGMVSADDRGFTLGDGLFETIPIHGGNPFLLDRHMARLRSSATVIKLMFPCDERLVMDGIATLCAKNSVIDGVARLTVTRGEGARGYGIKSCINPTWTLTVRKYDFAPKNPYTLAPVSIRRCEGSVLHAIKSTSALDRIMAYDEAVEAGADEALIQTTDGHISGAAAANIFWVKDKILYTPSLDCAILPGVTREAALEIAAAAGIACVPGRYGVDVIKDADEMFITNSLIGVAPVIKVHDNYDSDNPGRITGFIAAKLISLSVP